MSAVVPHVIMVMIVWVAKVTTFPLSVNKINLDHLIHEPSDMHKVFTIIKLKTFKTDKWVQFMLSVSQISDWVYSFN